MAAPERKEGRKGEEGLGTISREGELSPGFSFSFPFPFFPPPLHPFSPSSSSNSNSNNSNSISITESRKDWQTRLFLVSWIQ